MRIARAWMRLAVPEDAGLPFPDHVCGFGDDEPGARTEAERRLARLTSAGAPPPRAAAYDYGTPPREEVVADLEEDLGTAARAVLTRNRYGAVVLDTDRLLILDVDRPPPTPVRRGLFARLFGRAEPESAPSPLEHLREGLAASGLSDHRLYETAAGRRALVLTDRIGPTSEEARNVMAATGTDPCYARLCGVQACYRARLTPKPWRLGFPSPPGRFPRQGPEEAAFASWLAGYDAAVQGHAVCRKIAVNGRPAQDPRLAALIELRDQATRATTDLPLA